MTRAPVLLLCVLAGSCAAAPPPPAKPTVVAAPPADPRRWPTIAEKVGGLEAMPGYFTLYWDAREGKLWMEVHDWQRELLYQSGLSAGVGSNDIGLDRGQLGATRIVRFERIGPRVLLIQENLDYRAGTDAPHERR